MIFATFLELNESMVMADFNVANASRSDSEVGTGIKKGMYYYS